MDIFNSHRAPVMTDVMNPTLYARLQELWGADNVGVVNQGVEASIVPNPATQLIGSEEMGWSFDGIRGENYTVRCPYCKDRGRHMSISYLSYASPKLGGIQLAKGPLVVNCYHGCFEGHPERIAAVDRTLKLHTTELIPVSPAGSNSISDQYSSEVSPSGIRTWAPDYHTLDTAPQNVLEYIQSRRYTAEYLSAYHIGWGRVQSPKTGRYLNRGADFLIIPVIQNGSLRGFQARVCMSKEEADSLDYLRFYTHPGLPKSTVLYNIDNAAKYPLVCVTEGPMDALRAGACGVAVFGRPSIYQKRLMVSRWASGALIWLPDAPTGKCKTYEEAESVVKEFNEAGAFAHGAYVVKLGTKDPDEAGYRKIWDTICKQTNNLPQRLLARSALSL